MGCGLGRRVQELERELAAAADRDRTAAAVHAERERGLRRVQELERERAAAAERDRTTAAVRAERDRGLVALADARVASEREKMLAVLVEREKAAAVQAERDRGAALVVAGRGHKAPALPTPAAWPVAPIAAARLPPPPPLRVSWPPQAKEQGRLATPRPPADDAAGVTVHPHHQSRRPSYKHHGDLDRFATTALPPQSASTDSAAPIRWRKARAIAQVQTPRAAVPASARGAPQPAPTLAVPAPEVVATMIEHDFFLYHYQATGGDQVMTLKLKLSSMGFKCWLDQNAASITKDAMAAGVASSRIFLLFLSEGVLARPFCIFEIETAMRLNKQVMLMHETGARHGAFDFAEAAEAPVDVAELLETHESLPWRRRRFEQEAILNELVRTSGLDALAQGGGAAEVAPALGAWALRGTADDAAGLAPVPDTCPPLLESYSARMTDQKQILEVLLDRSAGEASGKSKVLAHGMGGLGKTTMAASIVRAEEVRRHYSRIGFVSAGQEPATMEEQRALYHQLTNEQMTPKADATVQSQKEQLQAAAGSQQWLVVLDDIWTTEHES